MKKQLINEILEYLDVGSSLPSIEIGRLRRDLRRLTGKSLTTIKNKLQKPY